MSILKKIFVAIGEIGCGGLLFILFPIIAYIDTGSILSLASVPVTVPFGGFFTIQGLNYILYDAELSPCTEKTREYLKLSLINSIGQSIVLIITSIVAMIYGIAIDTSNIEKYILISIVSLVVGIVFIIITKKTVTERKYQSY